MKKFYIFIFIIFILFLTGCSNNNKDNSYNSEKTSYEKKEKEVELSTFSTKIYTKTSGRQTNISISCNALNGKIIYPGETFSFCDIVGPSTVEKGYKEADVFDKDGNIVQGLGGGNCQISTTIYNAVLLIDGIQIIERHEHSNYVPYIEDGKDAAVSYGSVDLKFKNNRSNPIKLYMLPTEDVLTTKIVEIINE